MKKYLLIAGHDYELSQGTGDWIKCFETNELAENSVEKIAVHTVDSKGSAGKHFRYKIYGREYDWYEIVDLAEWMDGREVHGWPP